MTSLTQRLRRIAGLLRSRLPELRLEQVADPRSRRGRRWKHLSILLRATLVGIMAGSKSLSNLESLTDEMERRIEERVLRIEAAGEPAQLCETGWFRGIFQEAMERHTRELGDGTLRKVGVNEHVIPEEEDVLLLVEVVVERRGRSPGR